MKSSGAAHSGESPERWHLGASQRALADVIKHELQAASRLAQEIREDLQRPEQTARDEPLAWGSSEGVDVVRERSSSDSSRSSSGSERGNRTTPISAADILIPQRRHVERLLLQASVVDALVNAIMALPVDPVEFLTQANSIKKLGKTLQKNKVIRSISEACVRAARRARDRKANAESAGSGSGPCGKFQGLIVAAYGSASEFCEGIDGLGIPRDDIFKGMCDDMTRSADSQDPFKTSNYGGTWTTPFAEWEFVVSPNMHSIYPGHRKPVRIEIFYFAMCAIRSNRSGTRLFPSMVSWAPYATTLSCAKIRISNVETPDGKPSGSLNSVFTRTNHVVNGLPIFQDSSEMFLWWCGRGGQNGLVDKPLTFNERETLKSKLKADGGKSEQAQENGQAGWPSWIVGTRDNVGSNRGCMFIYSSQARPEQTGRHWQVWDGLEWREQKHVKAMQDENPDSDCVRWMDYKSGLADRTDQEAVELVVLQRFVTQLNVAMVKEALADCPGMLQPDMFTDEAVSCLQGRLERALASGNKDNLHDDLDGQPVCTVPNVQMAAVVEALEDILDAHQLRALIDKGRSILSRARFVEEEVIALRLYTGCIYMKMNGALRHSSGKMPEHLFHDLKGNTYVSVMHALVSGVIKLSLICILPANGEVFRGLSGFQLPSCFHNRDEYGAKGGVDYAFMSTTTNMKVALDYSKGSGALVFRIAVGMIDRGADLCFLSQYPSEREILMPPRSCLEVRGEPYVVVADHGDVTVINAGINCNLSCSTLDKTKARRKHLCVSLIETLAKEVSRDVATQSQTPEFVARAKKDVFWMREDSGQLFLNSISSEIALMVDTYHERSTEWYLTDAHLQKAVTDALPLPALARAKLRVYLDNPFLFCYQATTISYAAVARREIGRRRSLLQQARATDDTEALRKLSLEECTHRGWLLGAVDQTNQDGETAMLSKCAEGDVVAVKLLFEARADAGATTVEKQRSALHLAAENGAFDVVQLLLSLGDVDVDALDSTGTTSLALASNEGHMDVLQVLVAAGANINVQNTDGSSALHRCTALHLACYGGHAQAAKQLVEAKGDLTIRDANGATALHAGCYKGYSNVLQALLECNDQVNVQTKRGRSPLHHAASNGHHDVVQLLLTAGAYVECVDLNKSTALHGACGRGHGDIVAVIVAAKANVNMRDNAGETPLAAACKEGHAHIAEFLRQHGALT